MTPTIYVTGNVNVDLIMGPLAQWPKVGTEIVLPHSETRIGGAAGNTALALEALGARSKLLASVGDDMFGRWLQSGFNAAEWLVTPGGTTVSVGLVDPRGERTFLTSQGHLSVFGLAHLLQLLPAQAAPGDILFLQGCFLSPPLFEQYEALLEIALGRGFSLALDTGWPPQDWSPELRVRVLRWLASIDHLMINEVEVMNLGGSESAEAAKQVLRGALRQEATLVVKRGAGGAVGYRGAEHFTATAPRVSVIDTIGAGDVFDAGYLAAHVAGGDLATAVAAGVASASIAISTTPRHYR
jgi:sugar/nucleoside kinase (ribokinase family)